MWTRANNKVGTQGKSVFSIGVQDIRDVTGKKKRLESEIQESFLPPASHVYMDCYQLSKPQALYLRKNQTRGPLRSHVPLTHPVLVILGMTASAFLRLSSDDQKYKPAVKIASQIN